MKKVILIFSLFMFTAGSANASELFGQISTNPSDLPGQSDDSPEEPNNSVPLPNKSEPSVALPSNSSAAILVNRQKTNNAGIKDEEIKVLGISYEPYPDNSLLRAKDKNIYIIERQVKKHIVSLNELIKYVEQTIYDVTDEELDRYQERKHLNGDLIREQGKEKIYIIENAGKRHIISLEELRAHYFGQEIYNISAIEIKLYPHH